ncbi:TorF family putative porin [Venatoribacter cucullus]|uniref:TorF family putative porin n=1 Tax=Venatoribacter cucullus TaxID=2661630 RepID=UPI00223E9077|nr:TorF family putative porin [Venatoribacter cucullus]UZK04609.1 histidine kinase [Venatoribacter cucullus]
MKKLSQVIALAGVMSAGLLGVQAVQAEVSASAAIANNYIFRGLLMGSGTPAVSGALDYAHESGAYAGVWGTSGDTAAGDEYNVYFGFGGEASGLSYDLNVLTYVYPGGLAASVKSDLGQLTEVTASVGYGAIGLSVTAPVSDEADVFGNDYVYTKLSLGYEAFGLVVANNAAEDGGTATDYTHVDLSYAFNDNVSFGLSKIVDGDISQRTLFQVSYSLPIEL